MPFVKKFELKLYVPPSNEVAADIPEKWAEGLITNAQRIYDRLMEKVPDEGTFIKTMVDPSTNEYANFVNPGFRSKGGRTADNIKQTKYENMWSSFEEWLKGLAHTFGDGAQQFKTAVANAKSWLAIRLGAKALRFTGDKIRGRGPTPVAAYWLVGDSRAREWIRSGDESDGSPYDIARDGEEPTLKAAIQQRLVQGGMLVVNSRYQDTAMDAQNTLNGSVLNGLRDTAKCDAFSATYDAAKPFCLWRVRPDDGRLYLHLQVGLTV
ncbi:MAG: hypothetical protein HY762_07330 [Planctomycetes bacterium]|nr:hypothetical protein [Planctomycetota bacterium]